MGFRHQNTGSALGPARDLIQMATRADPTANQRQARRRKNQRKAGLVRAEIWRPAEPSKSVLATITYVRGEIERGRDIALDCESAREMMEYLGG